MLNKTVNNLVRDLFLDTGIYVEKVEVSGDLKVKDLIKRLKPDTYYILVWKKDSNSKKTYITVVYWAIGNEYSDAEEWLVFRNPLINLFQDPCLRKDVAGRGLNLLLSKLFRESLSFYRIYDYDI